MKRKSAINFQRLSYGTLLNEESKGNAHAIVAWPTSCYYKSSCPPGSYIWEIGG